MAQRVGGFWQSYADLAMGLLAVFALVLVLLLWLQGNTTEALAEEKRRTEEELEQVAQERLQLQAERSRFAVELLELIDTTYQIVEVQDAAETWVRRLFEEHDCLLVLSEAGALELAAGDDPDAPHAAELYQPGAVRLSPQGQEALESCQRNFVRLAYCLSPTDAGGDIPTGPVERTELCASWGEASPTEEEQRVIEQLRRGVEALVLEGNTDRTQLESRATPSIESATRRPVELADLSENFVDNAFLGAERARQALGHLLGLVQGYNEDDRDALQVLMSRARIESASFGRYQVGPTEWREPGCEDDQDACDPARNLGLRLRWQKDELRRPFDTVRQRICALLSDPDSAFSRGLTTAGRDPEAERQRFHCSELNGVL